MNLFYRAIVTIILTGLMVLCLFGFFTLSADYRTSRQMPWRLVCLAGIVGCVTGTISVWSKNSDGSK